MTFHPGGESSESSEESDPEPLKKEPSLSRMASKSSSPQAKDEEAIKKEEKRQKMNLLLQKKKRELQEKLNKEKLKKEDIQGEEATPSNPARDKEKEKLSDGTEKPEEIKEQQAEEKDIGKTEEKQVETLPLPDKEREEPKEQTGFPQEPAPSVERNEKLSTESKSESEPSTDSKTLTKDPPTLQNGDPPFTLPEPKEAEQPKEQAQGSVSFLSLLPNEREATPEDSSQAPSIPSNQEVSGGEKPMREASSEPKNSRPNQENLPRQLKPTLDAQKNRRGEKKEAPSFEDQQGRRLLQEQQLKSQVSLYTRQQQDFLQLQKQISNTSKVLTDKTVSIKEVFFFFLPFLSFNYYSLFLTLHIIW